MILHLIHNFFLRIKRGDEVGIEVVLGKRVKMIGKMGGIKSGIHIDLLIST